MSYCTIKRSLARKQYELIVSNDPRNSKLIIDDVFKLVKDFLSQMINFNLNLKSMDMEVNHIILFHLLKALMLELVMSEKILNHTLKCGENIIKRCIMNKSLTV